MTQETASQSQWTPSLTELTGTKLGIVEAALETLKERGLAGASAREIARAGNLNQALIFYHFGSVRQLLLAVVDLTSARRMDAYGSDFEAARSLPELAALAQRIYAEDLENGYVTVLGEVVAGGVGDRELGAGVVARIEPWIAMVERKAAALLASTPFAAIVPARDLAFGLIAFYLGIDMLSHLEGSHARAERLLALGTSLAEPVDALLTAGREEGPS